MPSRILTVCLNPVLQKTLVLPHLLENEVNRSSEYYFDVSGKGINLTRVLVQLGADVIHLTHLGGMFRNFFLGRCREEKIPISWVEGGVTIRFCYTLLNREKGTTTEIVEEAQPVIGGTEEIVFREYLKLLENVELVVISGSKAAGYSDDLFPQMTREAKSRGKAVILDVRGKDLSNALAYGPDIIKPNYAEFIGTFYREVPALENTEDDAFLEIVRQKMQSLYREYGVKSVLTRGRFPVLWYDGSGDVQQSAPPACRQPNNTTGCGDAFTAGLAVRFLQGTDLAEAIQTGQECALKNAMSVRPGFLGA